MPISDLQQLQLGTESTWGTAVTPTVKLMGVEDFKIDPGVAGKVYRDKRGSLSAGALSALTEVMPTAKLDVMGLYEDIPYVLDNVFGQAAPAGSGPYTRLYAAPLGTLPAPRILTGVWGQAGYAYNIAGLLISKLVIKGENGGPMKIVAEWIGKNTGAGTLAALSDRTVTLAMGQDIQIFIDAWGGTIGTTPIPATAYAYELTIDTKRKGDQYLGALSAGNWHEGDGEGWTGQLKLSMDVNSTSKAVLDALNSGSSVFQRQVRLQSTSGTQSIRFDFAGTAEQGAELFQDRDGVMTFDTELVDTYNTGLANWFKAQVINGVAVLA